MYMEPYVERYNLDSFFMFSPLKELKSAAMGVIAVRCFFPNTAEPQKASKRTKQFIFEPD